MLNRGLSVFGQGEYWTDNAIIVTMTRADPKFSVTQRTGEVTQLFWQSRMGEREEYFTRYTMMKCGNYCLKSTVRTDEIQRDGCPTATRRKTPGINDLMKLPRNVKCFEDEDLTQK